MLHRIVLHLARHPLFPNGSARHGYEFVLPLTAEGEIDTAEWRAEKDKCRARRFWAGLPDRIGHFVRKPGGRGGATWIIDYDRRTHADDETGIQLDRRKFAPGEYISLADGQEDHTFQIDSVEPVTESAAAPT